ILHFAELALTASVETSDEELLASLEAHPARAGVLLLDASSRPVSLAVRAGPLGLQRREAMSVLDSTDIVQALKRALTRPLVSRFDPIACCNDVGQCRGVIPLERLIEALMRG
ncbi:MAG TPA: hypothetical protein VI299_26060, partial [Polyangiales bacterium]